jgi:hypothetical protein
MHSGGLLLASAALANASECLPGCCQQDKCQGIAPRHNERRIDIEHLTPGYSTDTANFPLESDAASTVMTFNVAVNVAAKRTETFTNPTNPYESTKVVTLTTSTTLCRPAARQVKESTGRLITLTGTRLLSHTAEDTVTTTTTPVVANRPQTAHTEVEDTGDLIVPRRAATGTFSEDGLHEITTTITVSPTVLEFVTSTSSARTNGAQRSSSGKCGMSICIVLMVWFGIVLAAIPSYNGLVSLSYVILPYIVTV